MNIPIIFRYSGSVCGETCSTLQPHSDRIKTSSGLDQGFKSGLTLTTIMHSRVVSPWDESPEDAVCLCELCIGAELACRPLSWDAGKLTGSLKDCVEIPVQAQGLVKTSAAADESDSFERAQSCESLFCKVIPLKTAETLV